MSNLFSMLRATRRSAKAVGVVALLVLSLPVGAVDSALHGPFYPSDTANLPGGAQWTSTSSSSGEVGKAGGVTWTISNVMIATNIDRAVWWGAWNNEIKASFDEATYTGAEVLVYRPELSNLPGGVAVWSGETQLVDRRTDPCSTPMPSSPQRVYVRFTLKVTDMASNPLALSSVGTTFGANVGPVLRITAGLAFKANLQFEASSTATTGFVPAYAYYDDWHDGTCQPAPSTANTSISCGFYYGYTPAILGDVPNRTAMAGTTASLSVTVDGLTPITFQWFRDPVPLPNETAPVLSLPDIQYNGTYQVRMTNRAGNNVSRLATVTVTNVPGGEIKPPPGTDPTKAPVVTPANCAYWNGLNLYAQNCGGLLSVRWTDTNGVPILRDVWIRELTVANYIVGQEMAPPALADTNREPTCTPAEAVFWHRPRRKLYSVSPQAGTVRWQNASGSAIDVPFNSVWPTDAGRYQLYVAGSPPADLVRAGTNVQAMLRGRDGTLGTDEVDVSLNRRFQATGPGKALLLLTQGSADTATNLYFQFVQSVLWSNAAYLHDNAVATIGQPITNHFGYHNVTNEGPFVVNVLSRYCAQSNYYDRTTRTGPIVPVNRDRVDNGEDDMVVTYYRSGTNLLDVSTQQYVSNAVAWPWKAVRYDCRWPTNAPTIVIASTFGSGPVDASQWNLYLQNDPLQPGFNPNDEHAMFLPAQGVQPQFRVSPEAFMILEGGWAQVTVSMLSPPVSNVLVSVAGARDGDADITSPLVNPTNVVTQLEFTPLNWQIPQTIVFQAGPDADSLNGSNRFTIRASGGVVDQRQVTAYEADTNGLGLLVAALACTVPEGATYTNWVRLTRAPTTNVSVTVVKESGSSSWSVVGGSVMLTPGNWDQPQPIAISSAPDDDSMDGLASFRVSASGGLVASNTFGAVQIDRDLPGMAVFALRDDVGDRPGTVTPTNSEPYVLLRPRDARSNSMMRVFRVVAEEAPYFFQYSGRAGRAIQPPYPLPYLGDWQKSSYGSRGPYWQDRKLFFWARAAGDTGGTTNLVMKYFYPVQTGFFFPEGPVAVGTRVPWLDRRVGGAREIPTDITYTISWPDDTPELRLGESLIKRKFGLPDIAGQTSVEIIYQQSSALGQGSSAEVIDPTFTYQVTLADPPPDALLATNQLDGTLFFAALPPNLRDRIWYDPLTHKIKYKGRFQAEFGTEEPTGYLLLNVITERDKAQLRSLSESPEFRSAIDTLALQASQVRLVGANDAFDSLALTAGRATGVGYVSLAMNNAVRTSLPADRGTPVSLEIFRVTCPLYRGETKVI